MTWSPQQEEALAAVRKWLQGKNGPQVFRLFGYAGTGKTTLAKELAAGVPGLVMFGAFTGKAALMMRKKGCDGASTIHSMIYKLDDDHPGWEPTFVLNHSSAVADAKLVIIDECSMVDEQLATDLLLFGSKVLVLGDPAQLPPVRGASFFTAHAPDFMLTEVHRQARDNPIIRMSMAVRAGDDLQPGEYGESRVVAREAIDAAQILQADQILVGLNRTREAYNRRIRDLLGLTPVGPQVNDRLVCLRNDRQKRLLNGGLWRVQKVFRSNSETLVRMLATSDDHPESKPTEIFVRKEFFDGRELDLTWEDKRNTQEFTYGYALTVHKAQGSQWDNVIVFDEKSAFREDAHRWIYTAITRAAERVTVVR